MGKVKYREPSGNFEKLASPNKGNTLRTSIGRDGDVQEFYLFSIEKLIPYHKQARKYFSNEEIDDLAATIKEHGIQSPLLVIPSSTQPNKYEIVSGERRFRAAVKLGLEKLPCIIIESKDAEEVALIENIQRESLHPIELADAIARLLDEKQHGQQTKIAEKIGVSKHKISHLLAISRLPEDIKSYLLQKKEIKIDFLKKLAYLKDEQSIRDKVFNSDINQNKYRSVLRLSFNGENFKWDRLNIDKLSTAEKDFLKSEFYKLIERLNT